MPTAECEPAKSQDTEGADSAYMHEDNFFTTPSYTESLKCSAVFNPLPEHICPFSTAAIKRVKLKFIEKVQPVSTSWCHRCRRADSDKKQTEFVWRAAVGIVFVLAVPSSSILLASASGCANHTAVICAQRPTCRCFSIVHVLSNGKEFNWSCLWAVLHASVSQTWCVSEVNLAWRGLLYAEKSLLIWINGQNKSSLFCLKLCTETNVWLHFKTPRGPQAPSIH